MRSLGEAWTGLLRSRSCTKFVFAATMTWRGNSSRTIWQRYVIPFWTDSPCLYEGEEVIGSYRRDFKDFGKEVTLQGRKAVVSSSYADGPNTKRPSTLKCVDL